MILLDSTALIAFLADEPAAERVGGICTAGDAGITAANLVEVLDILIRRMGFPQNAVDGALDPLLDAVLPVVSGGLAEARSAARVRIRHYHRLSAPLSLADCLLLGTALATHSSVASADRLVLRTAQDEGLRVEVLPDSEGHLHGPMT